MADEVEDEEPKKGGLIKIIMNLRFGVMMKLISTMLVIKLKKD